MKGFLRRGIADRLTLYPSTGPSAVAGVSREMLPYADGTLEIWSARTSACVSREPEKYVLCFGGNGSRADREFNRMPALWGRFPVEFCAANYPGYGASTGAATLASIPAAALAAFDAVALRAGNHPIFVTGSSLGTAAALCVAARRDVAGIVLHNPPPLRQLIRGRFGWCSLWLGARYVAGCVPKELDSLQNAALCRAPAVMLLAALDTLVTPPYQKMVVEGYAGPVRVVHLPNSKHNTPVLEENLAKVEPAMDWLWEQTNARRSGSPRSAV